LIVTLVWVLSRFINLAIVGLVGVELFLLRGDLGSSLESDFRKARFDIESNVCDGYCSGKLFCKSTTYELTFSMKSLFLSSDGDKSFLDYNMYI